MQKILQSTVKVRFQDCDPFNHLYNTRYLDYFLNSREDQLLDAYNLDAFSGTMDTGRFGWYPVTRSVISNRYSQERSSPSIPS
jgi:acyl-CoA thioester hydrolase